MVREGVCTQETEREEERDRASDVAQSCSLQSYKETLLEEIFVNRWCCCSSFLQPLIMSHCSIINYRSFFPFFIFIEKETWKRAQKSKFLCLLSLVPYFIQRWRFLVRRILAPSPFDRPRDFCFSFCCRSNCCFV